MTTTTSPGSDGERPYHVVVTVDGYAYWSGAVSGRSAEHAAIDAFCQALHTMLHIIDAGGTPPQPAELDQVVAELQVESGADLT